MTECPEHFAELKDLSAEKQVDVRPDRIYLPGVMYWINLMLVNANIICCNTNDCHSDCVAWYQVTLSS